jgi:hypothetical protein
VKGNRAALIIILASVLVLVIFFLYSAGRQKRVNWFTTFREKEEQPYDLSVISKVLDDYFPQENFTVLRKPVNKTLPVDSVANSCYVFIGASLYLYGEDLQRLYDFVEEGNAAFIAANTIPDDLLTTLLNTEDYYDYGFSNTFQKTVTLNFTHPALKKTGGYWYDYIIEWEKHDLYWNYLEDSILVPDSSSQLITLGKLNDDYVNFIEVPFGKGKVLLHTTPLAFTNYYLKEKEGLEYAEKVFSHLSSSNIYWDEFSKVPQLHDPNVGNTETPLRYILSQTSLKWSWYVLLSMVALFLLFRVKRDQRIIPVVEENTNTSLEFIHTIGRLYFLQNDHRALAMQKMRLFLAFIRNRYGLVTKALDTEFIQKLSEKSQVRQQTIEAIAEKYNTINNMDHIPPEQLIDFHSSLDEFYTACK